MRHVQRETRSADAAESGRDEESEGGGGRGGFRGISDDAERSENRASTPAEVVSGQSPAADEATARKPRSTEIYGPYKDRRVRYTRKLGQQICELISFGHTVGEICKRPGMPNRKNVFAWVREIPEFRKEYLIARAVARQRLEDEILEIVDDASNDVVELKGKDGKTWEALNPVAVQRAKAQVAARQKMIEWHTTRKLDPHFDEAGNPIGADDSKTAPANEMHYRLTEERRAALMARRRAQIEASKREAKPPPTPDAPNSATQQ